MTRAAFTNLALSNEEGTLSNGVARERIGDDALGLRSGRDRRHMGLEQQDRQSQ